MPETQRTIPEVIGGHIREAREKRGFTQANFGRVVGRILAGKPWSPQAVSQAEKGQRAFTAIELVCIAYVLEVPMSWLFAPDSYDERILLPDGRGMYTGDLFHSIAGSWFQPGEKEGRRQQVLRSVEEARWQAQRQMELLDELRLEVLKLEEQTTAEDPDSVLEEISPRPIEEAEAAAERLVSEEGEDGLDRKDT